MNKPCKIFLSAILINTIFISTVLAEPVSEKLQKQQNKLQQDKSSLKMVQNKKANIEINIENLDNQIEGQMAKITEDKKQISKKEADIKNTEIQIQKVDADLIMDQNLFNRRSRVMYENGNASYILILLSSNGFSDFFSRIDIIKRIIELDKKIVKDLNEKKEDSKNIKEVLSNENKKLLILNTENRANLFQIQGDVASQKNMIIELNSKEFKFTSNINSSQVAVDATLKQIATIRKAVPKEIASRGYSKTTDNNIIAYATNFLGTPYVWGGTSPSPGFDCSGFTQYVYAHFGIRLGRTTYDQITNGVEVTKSNLQPGDLVFFGTNGSPEHMGMYVANGTYINAPHTGDVVKISSVDRIDYITARRVK